ncbi:MAG: MMPL family transporter [Acidimicrobiales bacterium]
MNAAFGAFGRGVVKLRWLVIALWVVGTIFAVRSLPSLSSQVNGNNSQFLPANAPSNRAAVLAEPLIGSTALSQIPVVAVTSNAGLGSADKASLARLVDELGKVPTVKKVQFLAESPDGKAVQILVTATKSPFDQIAVNNLVTNLDAAISRTKVPSDLHVNLAGALATNVANQKQSSKTGNRIQIFSILFIVVLLLIIFRSFLAPLVTLLPAIFALQLAGAFIGGLGSTGLKISSITQLLLIVLILGAGTDYGLFLVFRVREELLAGREPKEAVAVSLSRVGESITASAATVIVALLSLLLASFGIYHDLGVPLAVGIGVMLVAGLTLLPALLAVLGRAVFWPSKTAPRERREGLWGRVAGRLVQRPALSLSVGVLVFAALAAFVVGFKPGGFGGEQTAPSGSRAAEGNSALTAHFPQASENPTNIIMRFASSVWASPARLQVATHKLESTGEFTTVSGPLDPTGKAITPSELEALHAALGPAKRLSPLPPSSLASEGISPQEYNVYHATARYISTDGSTVQWEVGLKAGAPGTTASLNAVPGIRAQVASIARYSGASASGVAGEAPALYDVSHISDADLRRIVPVAVLVIGVVLAVVLRSLVAPIYLILSVLLSYLASLGLAVIVFMKLEGNAGVVFLLPFLMFIFLLALGEDYNILVMTRIREEATKHSLREAVVRAVGATGPTVTSAGLVLAGTFAVLAVAGGSGSGGSQVQAIGFGLAVGILLDTFVVRTVLVPSAVALLGRWNWWPSKMGRRHVERNVGESR